MTHGTDEPREHDDADPVVDPLGGYGAEPRPGAHAAEPDEPAAGSFDWTPDTSSPPEVTPSYDTGDYQLPVLDYDSVQPQSSEPYPAETPYPSADYQTGGYQGFRPEQQYPVPPAAQQQSYEQQGYEQFQGYPQQPAYQQQPAYDQQQPAYEQPPAPPAPQYPSQAPPPPPVPRPEDLLVPNQQPLADEPASWGWRGRLNRASGGMMKPKASPAELAVRTSIADIQHSFSRPMTVVVVQPKGGAGKTPTTICLAAALGAHRGGYVVGWDDNETRGTLAVRVSNPDNQQATVWNLLSDLAAFERYDARVGDLSRYVRAQPDAHFDALVSDDNPGNMAQIGETEYKRLHTVLQRFYRMIIVDTGNNVRSSNWQAAVHSADQIVVVSTYQRDVGYSASWVLDHLAQSDRPELARNAVTILSAADPTTDKEVRDQLVPHFQARTRAVCEIPYDTELAHGGPIRWAQLAPATRNAWIHAGATIVNCLADDDRRAVAARPT